MNNIIENSEALKRVWKWKEDIYNDVRELTTKEKLKKIHHMAEQTLNLSRR